TGDPTNPNNEMTCIAFTAWPTATMSPADVAALAVFYSALDRFDVATGRTADQVVDFLKELKKAADTLPADRLHDFLLQKAIPFVTERAEQAEHAGATKLAPWLRNLQKSLQSAANTLILSPASSAAAPVKPTSPQEFFDSLAKAAAINPRSSAALERDAAKTYSSGGDIAPRLLTKLRPVWQDVLYPALRNGISTPSAKIAVYVMRRTAALFGNAVPREPQFATSDGEIPRI